MSFYLKALKALLLYPWANVNTISLILHHSDLRDVLLSYSKGGGGGENPRQLNYMPATLPLLSRSHRCHCI